MAIPAHRLLTWSHQGPVQSSAATHKSVRNCIEKIDWNDDVKYVTYLQGSYPNYTNIYGNSDVDLVVEFQSIFTKDLTTLTDAQRAQFEADHSDAKFTLEAFKLVVIQQLRNCFGTENIEVGNKSILVRGNDSRLDCDVVVCNPYRKYTSYTMSEKQYIEGIKFQTEITKRNIINYPKVHISNGREKNRYENTREQFKPVVRIFKNIKADMVKKGYIEKDLAPSYFLECLTYNSRNSNFSQPVHADIAVAIINQYSSDADSGAINNYMVQNQQEHLFGAGNQQWNVNDATRFINQLIKYWNEFS